MLLQDGFVCPGIKKGRFLHRQWKHGCVVLAGVLGCEQVEGGFNLCSFFTVQGGNRVGGWKSSFRNGDVWFR